MTDPAPLTDEELAEMELCVSLVGEPGDNRWHDNYAEDVPRLIAALRAARAEVERLRGEE